MQQFDGITLRLMAAVQMLILILSSTKAIANANGNGNVMCQIDSSLRGVFMKQADNSNTLPAPVQDGVEQLITYDKLTISSSAVSSWGNCYESVGDDSFIFGMKRIGEAYCYRCVTLVLRAANIIQAAHQTGQFLNFGLSGKVLPRSGGAYFAGNPCRRSIDEARKTCFDSEAISASQGTFLYRVENVAAASCGLEGVYDLQFKKTADSTISCQEPGSSMSNCESVSQMKFHFRNCTFPDFDLTFTCIGLWHAANDRAAAAAVESFIAIQDNDNEQVKCGILVESGRSAEKTTTTLYLSKDANCDGLSGSNSNTAAAAEQYTFTRRESGHDENWVAACTFPEWLQGAYQGGAVRISERAFAYSDASTSTTPTVSYCLALDGLERIAVFTESK
ncbi:unnamed protein product [Anisakis simplex]|uniref:Expansin-like EG45 domain-containing protein n=1 Tax=Anisakis simplex TaxID=6269 RepID=A0A0M3K778_ANISI|nr:unnamed protein product [Anisakis simplex]